MLRVRTGVDLGVEATKLSDGDGVLGGNIVTGIARFDLVPLVAVGHDAGQGRGIAGRGWRGGGGRGSGDTGADIVVKPEVRAGSVDLGIPGLQLGRGNTVLLGNRIATIARLNLVEAITVSYDTRHEGRVAGRGTGGRGGGRGSSARNVDTDIIIEPKVGAGGIDLGVPGLELRRGDTVLLGNGIATVAGLDLVETITNFYDTRHGGGVAGVGGRADDGRSPHGGGWGGRRRWWFGGRDRRRRRRRRRESSLATVVRVFADDAVRLPGLKDRTGHAWVELTELLDRNAPGGGHVIAGLTGLCLDVKVTSDITGDEGSQTAGRNKVKAQAWKKAE